MVLYDELGPWYMLLDPTADHEAEATSYVEALRRHVDATSLLDLGAGAGNNAFFLRRHIPAVTLVDLSQAMLDLSRAVVPDAERVCADMRDVRLDRTFDAVLVHDAIDYMTTEADLRAAITTAFAHTRPGGAAIFVPDVFREDFEEETIHIEGADGARALRCIEWSWDPDPADTTVRTDYVVVLRDGRDTRVVHDRQTCGLFPRATWTRLLEDAGFEVGTFARPLDDGETTEQAFLCRRPG